jgi:hypothetical protein
MGIIINLVIYSITEKPIWIVNGLGILTWFLSIIIASVVAIKMKKYQHVVTIIIIVALLVFQFFNASAVYYMKNE